MDFLCFIASVLFLLSGILDLIVQIREWKREHFDLEEWKALDPLYIQQEFDWRSSHRAWEISAGLINAVAWLALCFPLIQLAWILSHHGRTKIWIHISIGILAICGSLTEWISRFWIAGTTVYLEYMFENFNLNDWNIKVTKNNNDYDGDGVGLRVLEVTYITSRGSIVFVDIFEWIALPVILILIYVSVKRWRAIDTSNTFSGWWNSLGLFIAIFGVLEFIAQILKIDGFRPFRRIAFFYSAINRILFIPVWLLVLSMALPYAAVKATYDDRVSQPIDDNGPTVMMSEENATAVAAVPEDTQPEGPAFTIDDNDPNL